MLFANIHYYKDSLWYLTPEKRAEISAASSAWIDKYFKSGQCKARYWFGNGSGGIAIWEFESVAQMMNVLQESPVYLYVDSDVIPVLDYEGLLKMRKEREASQKKAKK